MLRRDASDDLWAQVAGMTLHGGLLSAKTILEQWGILRDGEFTHPLIREVIPAGISPERAQALARRALIVFAVIDSRLAVEYVQDANLSAEASLNWFKQAAKLEQGAGNSAQAARYMAIAVKYAAGEERSHTLALLA